MYVLPEVIIGYRKMVSPFKDITMKERSNMSWSADWESLISVISVLVESVEVCGSSHPTTRFSSSATTPKKAPSSEFSQQFAWSTYNNSPSSYLSIYKPLSVDLVGRHFVLMLIIGYRCQLCGWTIYLPLDDHHIWFPELCISVLHGSLLTLVQ